VIVCAWRDTPVARIKAATSFVSLVIVVCFILLGAKLLA